MAEKTPNHITIDGVKYDVESLSKQARAAIVSVNTTDNEIKRLKVQLAIATTARKAFAAAVKANLPGGKKSN